MTFLVLIVGLLLLRFGSDVRWLQRDRWFFAWCERLAGVEWLQQRDTLRGVVAVVVPALVLALLLWGLREWWLGVPFFVASLMVLLYSFGRGDLEGELRVYREAVGRGDTQAAYHGAAPFNPDHREGEARDWPGLQAEMEAGLPYRMLEREFAVIFWFALLGPAGALLYRLARLFADRPSGVRDEMDSSPIDEPVPASEPGNAASERLLGWLEWLPARLLVPSLAVVGNFAPVLQRAGPLCCSATPAGPLLATAVLGALDMRKEDLERSGGLELVAAIEDLLRRALVLWVLVVALLVLFA